ncbi:MAG: FAD-binding oxidoreductase [Proteobacteria bacterium]|nr:FAD-binding oxidoreductase [Pseudomonadota bacterium]
MKQEQIAVIGAGVIGCAIAWALSREGRQVLVLDRAPPGMAGASFGNVGHIAAELVQPLPSRSLLLGFWRELYVLGGALDIPLRRIPALLPWARRFAAATALRETNTRHLAPLVAPAVDETARLLAEIGKPGLLRRNGHYEVWRGRKARKLCAAQATATARLGIPTEPAGAEWLRGLAASISAAAPPGDFAALKFTGTGHVTDPWQVVQALVDAAMLRGARIARAEVRSIEVHPDRVDVRTTGGVEHAGTVVIAAGAWAAPLLEGLGLRVPLEAARGYHVELAGADPVADAPILYADHHIVVTPMAGRLRASSYMDFVGLDAPPDSRKIDRLLQRLGRLGYDCSRAGAPWWGPRPVLPDYLPGIGRVPDTRVFYAIGHQHIGLTLAAVTAQLLADLVAQRTPRHDVRPFDLRRFGVPGRRVTV